jgi:G protein-coupled receptor 107
MPVPQCTSVPKRLLIAFCIGLVRSSSCAHEHGYDFQTTRPLIAPIGTPFGFLQGGHFELVVRRFELVDLQQKKKKSRGDSSISSSRISQVEPAFLLKRFANEAEFTRYSYSIQANTSACAFEYQVDDDDVLAGDDELDPDQPVSSIESANEILLSMKAPSSGSGSVTGITYEFKKGEEGLYFLMYQVCPYMPNLQSNFRVEYHWYNLDRFGTRSYLSAGEMDLPMIFLYFSFSYLLCLVTWATNLWNIQSGGMGLFVKSSSHTSQRRPTIYAIHHFMTVLLMLKFLSVLTESIRYHFFRIHGHAQAWTVIYYAVTFIKGMFLFTLILLIGSGWSIVKPYLNARDKMIMMTVLLLQMINNLALVALSQKIEGEGGFDQWRALLHLVDIMCCCAVLFPLVWQLNALEKSIGEGEEQEGEDGLVVVVNSNELEEGEKGDIIEKLKLFRSFYLLVMAYIYATRILVYLLSTSLDYQHI